MALAVAGVERTSSKEWNEGEMQAAGTKKEEKARKGDEGAMIADRGKQDDGWRDD